MGRNREYSLMVLVEPDRVVNWSVDVAPRIIALSQGDIMSGTTEPDDATRDEERAEAERAHVADRAPTTTEEEAAERGRKEFESDQPEVDERIKEMNEIGADVKGEGQID
jgi:hypothetical protein